MINDTFILFPKYNIMRKLLFLLVLGTLISSCSKEEVKKEYTVISGTIDNFKSRNMTLKGYNFEKKINFDRKTKTFNDTLSNTIKPGHYTLFAGKRPIPLYITPTSKTSFTVDAKNRVENPAFTGTNAAINNYLSDRRKKFGLILGNANKLFSLNEAEFLSKIDEYKSALTDLVSTPEIPEDYQKKEINNIHYELARNLNNYQGYYRLLHGDEEFVVSENFPKKIIEDISFNESNDYVFSSQYRSLLSERIKKIANKRNPVDGDFDLTHLETVHTEVTDTLIKNDIIYKLAQSSITYTNNLSEYYKKFMGYSTSPTQKREITNTFDKLKLTARGEVSPKFENYENYEGGTTSLDDLLGKGKYIYIDVWATWCGFCKKEIPLLKRFEQQYHGKNIEFVSINVDTKNLKKKWKQTIEDKEMGGVQLFAGDKHSNLKFTKDYLIKGLPRFLLIDPDGKIISANAPRPSDGDKLEEIFDTLLEL